MLERKQRRRWAPKHWLYLAGGIVFALAIGLSLVLARQPAATTTDPYRFTIDQSLHTVPVYFPNSYFAQTFPAGTTAYVRELTDTITATFRYTYQGSEDATLATAYTTTARVRALNTPRGETASTVVWERSYPLQTVRTTTTTERKVTLEQPVSIPFHEYAQQITDLNAALALTLSGVVDVTFSVTTSGTTADNMPLNDQRTMTVSVPLTDAIYSIKNTYDTQASGTAGDEPATGWQAALAAHVPVAVIALLVGLALGCVVLAGRPWAAHRRTSYQRELARIYRYHDGLIIKTSRPVKVNEREIIAVEGFDDLLNLAEELHTPIIAGRLSDAATRFMVLHEATIYAFILGTPPLPSSPAPKTTPIKK